MTNGTPAPENRQIGLVDFGDQLGMVHLLLMEDIRRLPVAL